MLRHQTRSLVRTVVTRGVTAGALALGVVAIGQLPAAAADAGSYQVTITAPAQDPLVDVPFSVTGSVSPAADGAPVRLQREIAGTFETVATDDLDGSSHYAFKLDLDTVGAYLYRVVKPAGGGIGQGISAVKRVWVTGPTLLSGHIMRAGDILVSSQGTFRLTMRPNGNLELDVASSGRYLWSSRTGGHPGAYAILQRDGDLVVFDSAGKLLMHSDTGGHPGGIYSVTLQGDANLVIFTPGGTALWSSHTPDDELGSTESLQPGQHVTSLGGRYQAVMQAAGSLVVSDTERHTTLWTSETDVPGSMVSMQDDGDLMLRGPLGKPLWSSRTQGHPGAFAVMQDDGNLVVYQGSKPIWGSEGINGVLGDDYPTDLRNAPIDSIIDPWRFYNRECVSFVAWRMNNANHVDFSNFMGGGRFGNADNWDDNARQLGYTVDHVPARGAIAQSDSQGGTGHVAWVAAVGDGTVTVEDYNYSSPGTYGFRTVPTSTYVYIHIKDL